MIADAPPELSSAAPSPGLAFIALLGLTAAELATALGSAGNRAGRIAALASLLIAKVMVVLTSFMGARTSRRAARLVLVALVLAVGFAVVLMADTAARARLG